MRRLKRFLDQNIGGRKACEKRKEIVMRKLSFWVKGLFVVTLIVPQISLAQTQSAGEQQIPQLLFVQNAAAVVTDKEGRVITLQGLSPTTLYFSDRPVRLAGHYRTDEYLKFWKQGPESFLKDPPNATLSTFQKGSDDLLDVVVTLRNPRLKGKDLSYDVTVISGQLPKAAGPASLFIDIIGMPWTPLSFAGMARRQAYRTVLWGSAATAATAAAAYRPPVYVATPPAPPTVIVTPPAAPPAPAPAPAATQTSAVARLKELKSMLNQGLITQSQYQEESQKILNQLAE
jgi:hypothetical protein